MKNYKVITLVFALLILSQLEVYSQTGAANIRKVTISNSATVEYVKSETSKLLVNGLEYDQPSSNYYRIKNGDELIVQGKEDVKISVYAPFLDEISIPGTGKFYTDDIIQTDNLVLDVSGVGKLDLNVIVKRLDLDISGSGKVEIEGKCDELNAELSGAGKLSASDLEVNKATFNITGAGKAVVDVREELNANISGAGSVSYVTKPPVVNKNVTGIGVVGEGTEMGNDTTRIMLGTTRILIIGEDDKFEIKRDDGLVKGHWAGFEMGVNMLVDDKFSNEAPQGYDFLDLNLNKSVAVNLNLIDYEAKLSGRNVMLITGLGVSWNNYRFRSDLYLDPESKEVSAINDSLSYSKNKLVVSYLNVPLLFEFNTSEFTNRSVHLSVGVIGGLRLGSHVKLVRSADGDKYKKKLYDNFNLNPFKFDASVRFGYRNFSIFGTYSLNNFFKDSKDPELHPVTVGIRLVGW